MSDTPRNDPDHGDLAGLSGLYALDALDDEVRERFEEFLRTSPEARAEVEEFRATAAVLAGSVAEQPPTGLRDRVLAEVAITRQDQPVVDLSRRRAWRTRVAFLAIAAVVLLALGVAGGLLIDRGAASSDALADVLAQPDVKMVPLAGAGPKRVNVVWSARAGTAVVAANGMGELPEDRTMELWRITDDTATKVGLFRPDSEGNVRARFATDFSGADALGVTIEPAGGSDQPTPPIVLHGVLR